MRNYLNILLKVCLVIIISFSGCKKSSDEDTIAGPQPGNTILETTITSGQTYTVPNKISVVIPAGIANGATLRIGEIETASAPQDQNLTLHKVYNVTISSGSSFTTPLEITLYYDPARIPTTTQLVNVGASYYSESLQKWMPYQDIVVNTQNNSVTFKSNHLTALSVWHRQYTYGYTNYYQTNHFNIYWKSGEPMSNSQYQSPYTSHATSDPNYIQDMATYLEAAYTAYKNANLWVPTWGRVDVYVQDLGAVDGNSSFFGYLNINKQMQAGATGSIADVLQQTTAHEFLHYIQDYYYMQLFSDYTNKWWLEATATIGDHIVYSSRTSYEANEYCDGTVQAQFHKAWDDCNSDPEWYKAGGFLSYIGYYRSGSKASIPDLIRECGNKFNLSYFRTIIDSYLNTNLAGWKGIGKEYADYVKWAFERRGAIKIPIIPIISVNDSWVKPVTVSGISSQDVNFTLPHMSAVVVKIKNTNTNLPGIWIKGTNIPADVYSYQYNTSSSSVSGPYYANMRSGDSNHVYIWSSTTWCDYLFVNTNKDNDMSVSLKIIVRDEPVCVPGGTNVTMADGSKKPIESIMPSEKIAAYDTLANKYSEAVVKEILVHNDGEYKIDRIKLAGYEDLKITENHPVFIKDKGWTKAGELKPGDILLQYDPAAASFNNAKIVSIIKDVARTNVVYNLKTTKGNYIANDILIHNKCLKEGSLIDTPDGPVPIERIKPGMEVYSMVNGVKVKTKVTNYYEKETILESIPGKVLSGETEVTVNHIIYSGGKFIPAGSLNLKDSNIKGKVYDIKTSSGNYYCGGILMKCSE